LGRYISDPKQQKASMTAKDIEHVKQQQAKPHLVADRGSPATITAKEATSTIAIVMAALGGPGERHCL
jgi:hypothetical protein